MPSTVWKGHIGFGLVSFPIRLHAAARAEGIHFHLLHKKDLSRVKEVWYCASEEKRIERSDMVRGYETAKGHYIVVEDEELKKVAPPTASTMEILQFVASDAVDPIYFESSYYVAPEPAGAKPYALFFAALSKAKQHAIAKIAMHNREHVVLMRPGEDGLLLHTLFFANELHKANKSSAPKAKYSSKELQLAENLVTQLTGPFEPGQYHDVYRENVEKLIQQKRKGKKIPEMPKPEKAPVIDLMEALKQSLATHSKRASTSKKSARARHAA